MLADRDIEAAIATGDLVVEPLRTPIQPSSVDLRLGNQLRLARPTGRAVDPTISNDDLWTAFDLRSYGEARDVGPNSFLMPPGGFVLGHTLETIRLGSCLGAYIDGRSTLARNGLSVHVTAGFIDPGFQGQITLELQNVAPWPLLLRYGMNIGQLVLHRMSSAVRHTYGRIELGSKYQGQVGATLARSPQPIGDQDAAQGQATGRGQG